MNPQAAALSGWAPVRLTAHWPVRLCLVYNGHFVEDAFARVRCVPRTPEPVLGNKHYEPTGRRALVTATDHLR